jgi:hypothetical protein
MRRVSDIGASAPIVNYLKNFIANAAELSEQPLMQMFSLRHEFPTEWYRFLHPAAGGGEQRLTFTPARTRFPFFAQDRTATVIRIDVAGALDFGASHRVNGDGLTGTFT